MNSSTNLSFELPPLEQVLTYENIDVVDGLMKALDINKKEAECLFKEAIKWLWYCNQPKTKDHRYIDKSLAIIDEVWHTFILYTKDYAHFCLTHFGKYMHHAPTSIAEAKIVSETPKKKLMEKKRKQLELVYEVMGKETFIKWYHVFPEQYSGEKIYSLRKR